MFAKCIMVQGTGSHVGKSIITAGLCRLLRQDGYRVAPFKSQNMANNSFVTADGGEIGRAQAVQAAAAGVAPVVEMNPVLIKPTSDTGAQIVLMGRPYKIMQAREYQEMAPHFLKHVNEALLRLRQQYDYIVIEGAGSPAEINLQANEIVNMRIADLADAPVILAGDIDRGGVFASLYGTLELLNPRHRERIKAFLINKFRGDVSLLEPGLDFLHNKTGIPCLGVLPYDHDLNIQEEDGLSDARIASNSRPSDPNKIRIDVVWLPRISNFTDFSALDQEEDVQLTYLRKVPDRRPDVIILPGTKSTLSDLKYLRDTGFEKWIKSCAEAGTTIVGICGGYQMLGIHIEDRDNVEGDIRESAGLWLLPVRTEFSAEKETFQVEGRHLESGENVRGYEIHMGRTEIKGYARPAFEITRLGSNRKIGEGLSVKDGKIWGTYIHGVFDAAGFRRSFLNRLRVQKGWEPLKNPVQQSSDEAHFDRLADLIRNHIDRDLLYRILNMQKVVAS